METRKNHTSYGKCRCCLTKGNHRDIMKEYYYNGIREVYFDIFLECFNLFLSTNTRLGSLICSSCVHRLRDANSFKMMVNNAEQQLLGTLDDGHTVFVNVREDTVNTDVDIKTEQQADVKQMGLDFGVHFVANGNDDIPVDKDLVKNTIQIHQTEVKQEPSDFEDDIDCETDFVQDSYDKTKSKDEDLVEQEAALLARYPQGTLKLLPKRNTLYTTCAGFAKHLDMLKGKLIVPSMIAKLLEEAEQKRLMYNTKKVYVTEKLAHILNASTLLEFSNITPFKSKSRSGFPCFYCRNIFENLDKLKEHQTNDHRKTEIRKILSTYGAECLVVYVDVTDLKCAICGGNIPNLNELKSHLTKVHKKKMHLEFTDRVIPFKLSQNNVYECQICGFNFETFGSIERHMNVHYRNYVCKECGTGFVTKYRLKVHAKSMHMGGSFPCEVCNNVYSTQQKHKNHVDTVHKLVKRFKCPKCPERFSEYFRRQKHMVQAHGVAPLQYRCNVCDKTFDRRYTLSRHMKRDHLGERDFQCLLCSYKCYTNNELRVHMVKHNGERIFECSICKKSYARKKTLKEHMRIHNNDKRFACAVCGQAFVQKCSLKGHIKTHHLEYSLQ